MLLTGLSFPVILKRNNKEHEVIFGYGAITLSGFPFQDNSPNQTSYKFLPQKPTEHIKRYVLRLAPDVIFLQPRAHNKLYARFGLPPLSVAPTQGM